MATMRAVQVARPKGERELVEREADPARRRYGPAGSERRPAPHGTPLDPRMAVRHLDRSQDTLAFCALSGVRAMIEVFPLAKAARPTST
jgi:hypothetical protein